LLVLGTGIGGLLFLICAGFGTVLVIEDPDDHFAAEDWTFLLIFIVLGVGLLAAALMLLRRRIRARKEATQ
jgi:hypothetical protein